MGHILRRIFRHLPGEVADYIWELSFPRVFLRCASCGRVVLTVDAAKRLTHHALGYSVLHGSCRCALCLHRVASQSARY